MNDAQFSILATVFLITVGTINPALACRVNHHPNRPPTVTSSCFDGSYRASTRHELLKQHSEHALEACRGIYPASNGREEWERCLAREDQVAKRAARR